MLIASSLTVTDEPDPALVQRTRQAALESAHRSRKTARPFRVVTITIIIAIIVTGTAIAAGQLLLPQDVAKEHGELALSAAFEGEDAVFINESQTSGGYIFTLLGIVSGARLTDYPSSGDAIVPESTYAVIAIQNEDGTPIPENYLEYDESFDSPIFTSPLIKGEKPWWVNIKSMTGGYTESAIDGVRYRILDCNDISVFADRGIYICATNEELYPPSSKAYIYHDKTGEISPNPEYDGPNALFSLPLDKSKADPEKAAQFLNQIFVGEGAATIVTNRNAINAMLKRVEDGDLVLVKDSVKELTQYENGMVSYFVTYKGSELEGYYLLSDFNNQMAIDNHLDDTNPYIAIVSKDENGIIHGKLYVPK
jgi:hypothetical protein